MFYLSGTLFRGLLGHREAIAPLCFEVRVLRVEKTGGKKPRKALSVM